MNNLTGLLTTIPLTLRSELIEAFKNIERNFREGRWEPSELNGGKLCEVAFSILKGSVEGSYPPKASKPRNMVDACRELEKAPSTHSRSIRIQIPRMIVALYEVRNNRGVGHVGGDVNPNHMDAACVLQMSKWILSELIRIFHAVSTEEATKVVDAISEREISIIWKVNGTSRVLNTELSMLEKSLLLLYASPSGLAEEELIRAVEHSNPSVFRRDVLRKAHSRKLIEYDSITRYSVISPTGSQLVERSLLN